MLTLKMCNEMNTSKINLNRVARNINKTMLNVMQCITLTDKYIYLELKLH